MCWLTKNKRQQYKDLFKNFIEKIYGFYRTFDNSLKIHDVSINLKKTTVKSISLDYDVKRYFETFSSISSYRERLKESITEDKFSSISEFPTDLAYFEFRIKNINSIFYKIYFYIHNKPEQGEVPINKCLNDLFGARLIVGIRRIKDILDILEELKDENGWNCEITDSSKDEYEAVHLYLKDSNFALRWEIQFWTFRHEYGNRKSHAKYKQSYTVWEHSYSTQELFEVCD